MTDDKHFMGCLKLIVKVSMQCLSFENKTLFTQEEKHKSRTVNLI